MIETCRGARVIRHVRPKFSCEHCHSIVQAPAPARPITRPLAGPRGSWPRCWCPSNHDHLPLYRQSQDAPPRRGHSISSTLADWVGQSGRLLDPLVGCMADNVLAAPKLHADDTPVPVLCSRAEAPPSRDDCGPTCVMIGPPGRADAPAVWCAVLARIARASYPDGILELTSRHSPGRRLRRL